MAGKHWETEYKTENAVLGFEGRDQGWEYPQYFSSDTSLICFMVLNKTLNLSISPKIYFIVCNMGKILLLFLIYNFTTI